PWDILRYIRTKIERQALPHTFPDGVQFHFASSSSENWETLMDYGFEAFKRSEEKNTRKMFEILCDKEEWHRYDIDMIGMNPMHEREFDKSVGMPKLQERLLQTLHIHIVKSAEELMNFTSEWKYNAKMELDKMAKRIKPSKNRAELISEFCKQFILVFQTLFVSPLYTPTLHSDPWLKEFSVGIKRARETSTGYGWTLKDMWDIFETLKGTDGYAEFPPKGFQNSEFDEYMAEIERYINPAEIRFNTAQMLIQRLTQEYTMRSTLINLNELNVDEFVSRQVQARTSTQLNFGQAVDQKISEDYGRIFHAHERENAGSTVEVHGGNQWVSVFGAMCLLLHAEYTIRIMRDTVFSSLLQAQSDDPMQGILISKFERYWRHRSKDSKEQQNTESQIAKIMTSMGKTNNKKPFSMSKVSPIEDLSWALYAMFFEDPYNHFKKTLDQRTDLLVMTHATSLVHFYQLSGICVHQDEGYLYQWAANNPNSEYARAFLVRELDVKDGIDALSNLGLIESGIPADITKSFLTLLTENLKKFNKKNDNQKDTAIFSKLSETITEQVRAIIKSKPPEPEDKVKLFIDLADMGRNPDTFEEPESKTRFSEKEKASVNYIYKRRLTMGITSSVIDATQQLAKVQYEYSHQQTAPALQRELLGRVASLMLGYEYPYHPDARPSSKWYLSPKVVIQFLLANEDVFEAMSNSEESYEWKSLLDSRILESPMVKRIIYLSKPENANEEYNFRTVSNYIKKFETAKRDDIEAYIIEFLADDRFNWQPDQENLQRRVNNLKEDIVRFSKWHSYLEAYIEIAESVLLGKEDREPEIRFNMNDVGIDLNELAEIDIE
ncbi:17231_t:CDS:1, partial [Acaulospora colombiana]